MELNFDSLPINVTCAVCGQKSSHTFGRLKANHDVTCGCGAVTSVDLTGLQQGQVTADKLVDEFRAFLGQLNKR